MSPDEPPQADAADAAASTRLRTVLLTDICGSTAIVEKLGDAHAAELFRDHDRLVLRLQQQWHGRLIDRSDGLLMLFERPVEGLGFALDYLRGLDELGRVRSVRLDARTGLHVGEVLTWHNSEEAVRAGAKPVDVEGLAKPMAARLMALARPGQILLSAVAESLASRAASELEKDGRHLVWKLHGRWRFKGIPQAQEVYEVGEVGRAPLRAPAPSAKAWRDLPLWRRPAALAAEMLLLAGLGLGAWFLTRPQPAIAFAERDWVVMGDVRNLTGEKVLDDSLEQAFRISLEQSRHVNLLGDLKVRDTLKLMRRPDAALDRATASEVAVRDGARAVLLPTVAEVGGRVKVSLEVVDPATQATVYAESSGGRGLDSVLASVDTVTARMRGRLGEKMQMVSAASAPLARVTTASLDALRAYSLASQAMGNRKFQKAEQLYATATELDPGFALAYAGIARALHAQMRGQEGLKYVRKALGLSDRLSQRDRLYIDALAAELADRAQALDKWEALASVYPDSFSAHGNAAWRLFGMNRFNEAARHLLAIDKPQNPYLPIANDQMGRVELALGHADRALARFQRAGNADRSSTGRRMADALALQGRYPEALNTLDGAGSGGSAYTDRWAVVDRVSILLDQGRWRDAAAVSRVRPNASAGSLLDSVSEVVDATVIGTVGDAGEATGFIRRAFDRQAKAYRKLRLESPDTVDSATVLMQLAYVAQRLGDDALSGQALSATAELRASNPEPRLEKMRRLLAAQSAFMAGRHAEAERLLAPADDDLFQARVVLWHVLQATGRHVEAQAQARWLYGHRGLAYIEEVAIQSGQPLNVIDSRMAHAWAALSARAAHDEAGASKEWDAFVAAWPLRDMPPQLRRKIVSTFPASKE